MQKFRIARYGILKQQIKQRIISFLKLNDSLNVLGLGIFKVLDPWTGNQIGTGDDRSLDTE